MVCVYGHHIILHTINDITFGKIQLMVVCDIWDNKTDPWVKLKAEENIISMDYLLSWQET